MQVIDKPKAAMDRFNYSNTAAYCVHGGRYGIDMEHSFSPLVCKLKDYRPGRGDQPHPVILAISPAMRTRRGVPNCSGDGYVRCGPWRAVKCKAQCSTVNSEFARSVGGFFKLEFEMDNMININRPRYRIRRPTSVHTRDREEWHRVRTLRPGDSVKVHIAFLFVRMVCSYIYIYYIYIHTIIRIYI
jgi:hypothetical protein